MKRFKFVLNILFLALVFVSFAPVKASAATCKPEPGGGVKFLSLPTWYEYLDGEDSSGKCVPELSGCASNKTGTCDVQSGVDLSKIWLIALAVLDLLLRLGGFLSVGMVIFGGIKYVTSQGQSDATKGARQTIINAFVGMAIILTASVAVRFIASLLQK